MNGGMIYLLQSNRSERKSPFPRRGLWNSTENGSPKKIDRQNWLNAFQQFLRSCDVLILEDQASEWFTEYFHSFPFVVLWWISAQRHLDLLLECPRRSFRPCPLRCSSCMPFAITSSSISMHLDNVQMQPYHWVRLRQWTNVTFGNIHQHLSIQFKKTTSQMDTTSGSWKKPTDTPDLEIASAKFASASQCRYCVVICLSQLSRLSRKKRHKSIARLKYGHKRISHAKDLQKGQEMSCEAKKTTMASKLACNLRMCTAWKIFWPGSSAKSFLLLLWMCCTVFSHLKKTLFPFSTFFFATFAKKIFFFSLLNGCDDVACAWGLDRSWFLFVVQSNRGAAISFVNTFDTFQLFADSWMRMRLFLMTYFAKPWRRNPSLIFSTSLLFIIFVQTHIGFALRPNGHCFRWEYENLFGLALEIMVFIASEPSSFSTLTV